MMETRARNDLLRQIIVIASASFMVIAAMIGTGLLGGTPVQDLQGGALDADGSFLAPARPAFAIWTAIYVGLFAYTVWQALPGQRTSERQRNVGWWVALSMVLNGLWLVTAQFLTLPLTVASIVVLLAVLGVTFRRTTAIPTGNLIDKTLIDGVTGLHLGWVALATVANTSAWLTDIDFAPGAPNVWGIAVLLVVTILGCAVGFASGGRIAPALAIAWGSSWIAVARISDEPRSIPIGVAAIVVAIVVLIPPIVLKLKRSVDVGAPGPGRAPHFRRP